VEKKVLIVYEKMGMGHLRMANIVAHTLSSETELKIIKEAGSDLFKINDVRLIGQFWNYCIRKNWIRVADVVINFMLRLTFMPFAEVSQVASIHQRLSEIKPDLIISTADVWNNVLGSYAAEHRIPFFIVITDISIFIDLVNPYATHICYFPETATAVHSFDFQMTYFATTLLRSTSFIQKLKYVLKFYYDYLFHIRTNSIYRNINRELPAKNLAPVKTTGPMAAKQHFHKLDPAELKEKLGIATELPTVMISSGSIGGRFLLKIIKNICNDFHETVNILVMCGNDTQVYQTIQKYHSCHPTLKITPYHYQENFEEFLACADCLIARPSAGIFVESLIHRIPLVSYGAVAANDQGTLEIIQKYQTGECCGKRNPLTPAVRKVLARKEEYQKRIDQLLATNDLTYEAQAMKLKEIILNHGTPSSLGLETIKQRFTKEVTV
jgi:UDP-N-acetylglucosamine:LPS N-acetylglucosamine transferase